MPLTFNIRHLEHKTVALRGELPPAELDLGNIDELIRADSPLKYELLVEQHQRSVLVQGSLQLTLSCDCARCLKAFEIDLDLSHWSCLLPLEGEERVLIANDCVDLTPYLREDIVLAFPQHPLCEPECGGLRPAEQTESRRSGGKSANGEVASVWAELNKLKL